MTENDKNPPKTRSLLTRIGQGAAFTAATIGMASEPGCAPPKSGESTALNRDSGNSWSDSDAQRCELFNAVMAGDIDAAARLLDKGVSINAMAPYDGRTSLQIVADKGSSTMLDFLLGQKDINVNLSDKNGWAPLHYAARSGNSDAVEKLLKSGADANWRDESGATPGNVASTFGHRTLAEKLDDAARKQEASHAARITGQREAEADMEASR
jgi:hypothetical protein